MNGKRTLVITIALLAMLVTSGWAATLEVTQPVQVTSDSYYERGQAIVYDGADYWLFYGRSASCNTPYSGATNPDVSDYVLYYKKAGTVTGLASATATQVLVGATPVTSSYMGETAAAYFGSNVWVFATIHDGMSNTDLYGYYTGDGGTTWTQVGPYVGGMSAGQGHHDEIVFGGEVWILEGSGDFHTMHSSTPTNAGSFGTPLQVGSSTGGLGHFFVDGTDLYLALGSAGTYYIHKYNSGTVAWDLVDSKTISGYYDPTLYKIGSDYVFHCAPYAGGRQWIVGWTGTTLDGTFFDGTELDVVEGRYGANVWVDMWPIGFTAGSTTYLFYTSERATPSAEGPGNIWYLEVDWTVSNDHYTYVQEAVDAASGGDVVTVAPGLYEEAIVVDKSLSLLGATSGVDKNSFVLPATLGDYDTGVQSVIKAPAAGNPNAVRIESSDVTVQGFVIEALDRSVAGGNDYNNLIYIYPGSNEEAITGLTIKNNVIGPNTDTATQSNGRHGVRFNAGYGNTISALVTGNKIFGTYGNGNNVFIWGTAFGTTGIPPAAGAHPAADLSGTVIENNHICYSARSGVELSGAQGGLTIHNNRIYGNGAGHSGDADLKWGSGIMFVRDFVDVIHGSDPGIGAAAGFIDGVTISDNDIYDNTKNGFYFGPMNKNHTVTGNNIHDNGWDGFRVDLEGWYYSSSYFGGAYANAQYGSTSNIELGYGAIHGNTDDAAIVVGTPTNGFVLDASANWWGSADAATVAGVVSGNVDYTPWLASASDTSTDPGFQGDFSELWVDDDSDQTGSVGLIGEGIALVSGSTVNVAAGTYREQVKIDGKSLDLVGAGMGSTIVEAVDVGSRTTYSITQWNGSVKTIDACIGVVGPATVDISDLTVDGRDLGLDNFYGIHLFDTNGSVTDCCVENVTYPGSPGAQKVVSLVATQSAAAASYTIDFSDNVIPNFQKGGIVIMGPDITFTVDDNEVTSVPSDDIAGNGIQVSYGATGTMSGNVVQGVGYSGTDWAGTGILVFESGDVSMSGDVVHGCESGVAYDTWGWIYTHPSAVNMSVTGLDLYDNEWALAAVLEADNADINFTATNCSIDASSGDGIDLYGYTGWDHGDLVANITGCTITNTALDGIWIDDLSGNDANNTFDVSVHQTGFNGNIGSALWNGDSDEVDAEYCWWGDPAGPTVITEPPRANQLAAPRVSPYGADLPEQGEVRYAERSSSRAGDGVHGNVDYTPWLTGNIVCVPDPLDLVVGSTTGSIDVDYL
ncbi:right-handed parallel beta-helix repeat-containing protein, partial [bacterium]|nr:right-handed parallel beta-helix repeat-containing protein [bacterium]